MAFFFTSSHFLPLSIRYRIKAVSTGPTKDGRLLSLICLKYKEVENFAYYIWRWGKAKDIVDILTKFEAIFNYTKTKMHMRKIMLLAFALILLTSGYSQLQYGITGGLNLATIKYEGYNKNKTRSGVNVGFFVDHKLTGKFFLHPELLYSIKGSFTPADSLNPKITLSLYYLSLPVLIGYQANDKIKVLLGPEIGFLTSANFNPSNPLVDITKFYQKVDLGIDAGLIYNLNAQLSLGLKYNYGFNDLIKADITDNNGNVTHNKKFDANRVLQLNLYYLLSR